MDRRVMELSEEIRSSTDQRGGSDREDPSFKGMEGEKPSRRIDAPDQEAAPGDGSQPDDNASKQHDNVLLKTNSKNIARSNNRPPTDSNHNTCKLFQSSLIMLTAEGNFPRPALPRGTVRRGNRAWICMFTLLSLVTMVGEGKKSVQREG